MSKAYCGVGDIPKGFKKGSMKECVEKGQVRLYGLYKIDPKLLEADKIKEKKVKYYTLDKLLIILSELSGKISRLQKIIEGSKKENEVNQAKEDIVELKKERAKFMSFYKKSEKGEKVQVIKRIKLKKTTKKSSKKPTKKTSNK